eukprot:786666-Pleurochrysis_carterae.AAC.1
MPYKWGHPVATHPVTDGTIRHICRVTEILRINDYSDVAYSSAKLFDEQFGAVCEDALGTYRRCHVSHKAARTVSWGQCPPRLH